MRVSHTENGHVTVTLETHEEVVALWAVSAHVGGARLPPRLLFSNHGPGTPGLTQQLAPYVSMPQPTKERYGITSKNPPPRVQDTLAAIFGAVLIGGLDFHNTSNADATSA